MKTSNIAIVKKGFLLVSFRLSRLNNYMLAIFFILIVGNAFGAGSRPQDKVRLTGSAYVFPLGLEGTPYLHQDWSFADIVLENGMVAVGEKVKFNMVTNDLIFYNEDLKRIFILDKETVKEFRIKNGKETTNTFVKYLGNSVGFKLKTNDFVEFLAGDQLRFNVRHSADIVEANDVNSKNKVYQRRYYYVEYNGKASQVNLRLRSIYRLFPGQKKNIKQLVHQNKLKRSGEKNVKKLINLLNNEPEILKSLVID